MNPAMIAGTGINLANQLKNLIMGAKQIKDGKKLQAKLDAQGQPILETPESFTEVEGLVRSNYVDPHFKGESKMRDAIESRGANQIQNIQQTAGSGMDALMAYNVANANTDNNLFNLDMKSFEQQQADYQSLLGMLGQKAQYEDKQWMQNVLTPFVQSSEQAKALIGAGQQNVNNAMNEPWQVLLCSWMESLRKMVVSLMQQVVAQEALQTRMQQICAWQILQPHLPGSKTHNS